jgi:hypothetical protein
MDFSTRRRVNPHAPDRPFKPLQYQRQRGLSPNIPQWMTVFIVEFVYQLPSDGLKTTRSS